MSLFDFDLPAGFTWIRVGDAYEVTKKPRGLDISSVAAVPFATMEAIPQGGAYAPDYDFRPSHAIRTGTYFERGDVLVAKITPSFENGKQALVTELPAPFGFATTEVIPLRPRHNGQERRFLFFYLLHPDVRHHVAERMEGSTGRQRVPTEVLLDLPFPSLRPEDQVIVAESLESLLRLKSVEEQSIAATQALKRAAIHSLFSRGLRGEAQKETEIGPVPESWEQIPVSALGKIVTGSTPPTRDPANYASGTIPFVAPGDIEHGLRIESTEKFITGQGLQNSRAIMPGATCFVCIGSTIGKVGYTSFEICATNQQINSILPSEVFDSLFTFYLMVHWAEHVRTQASPSPVPILSKGTFEQIRILTTADIEEQREIVIILDAIDRKISLHRRKRGVLEELFMALLHKLMTGEIRVGELDLSGLKVN